MLLVCGCVVFWLVFVCWLVDFCSGGLWMVVCVVFVLCAFWCLCWMCVLVLLCVFLGCVSCFGLGLVVGWYCYDLLFVLMFITGCWLIVVLFGFGCFGFVLW